MSLQLTALEKISLHWALVCTAAKYWLERRPPKLALIATVLGCSYLGGQSAVLISKLKHLMVPSYNAVASGAPEWPLVVVVWSLALMFIAACAVQTRIAFLAAVQLYQRHRIVLAV